MFRLYKFDSTRPDGSKYKVGFLESKKCKVGVINYATNELMPCHGYYYPNRVSTSLMNYALRNGLKYIDCNMPQKKNKTVNIL